MRTVLTIDHQEFILPHSANVAAVIKALSGAVRVEWDYKSWDSGKDREYFVEKPVELSIKQVPKSCFKLRSGAIAPAEFDSSQPKLNGARRPLLLLKGGR